MKLIMENWREYLNEDEYDGPTVGEFFEIWTKNDPKSMTRILGKAAKYLVGLGGETGASAATGAAGTALGLAAAPLLGPAAPAGPAIGAAAGVLAGKGLDKLFDLIASKSNELARFMIQMAQQQVPDNERTGIALYFDLDDEYEALLQDMDSGLAKEWQTHLFKYFKSKFSRMEGANPTEPLSEYIEKTANQHLQAFLANKGDSGVGVAVQKLASPSPNPPAPS